MKQCRLLGAVCIAVTALAFSACNRQRDIVFHLESTNPLAVDPEVEWAVITSPYAACYATADYASVVATHYRHGEVLQVQGRITVKTGDKSELWYAFEEGWIPENALQVYPNKLRADNASQQLLSR